MSIRLTLSAVFLAMALLATVVAAALWMQPESAMTTTLAAVGVAVILVTAALGIRAASGIASAIAELQQGTGALAAGNYAARVKVRSQDETGALAAAFNRLAEGLGASHASLVERQRDLEQHIAGKTAEWQRAKEAEEENIAELRLITDLMPFSLCYVDRDRRYRFHNRRFAEWTGFAEQEIDGRTVVEVLGLASYADVVDGIDQALSGRVVSYERPNLTRDGTFQTIASHLIPHHGSEGKVIGFYAMSQDISERKRAEEALRKSNDELTRINLRLQQAHYQLLQAEKMASIGQLASGVAHEINNPIGYVYSNLSTLDRYVGNMFTLLDAYQVAEPAIADEVLRGDLEAARLAADIDFVKVDVLALLSESKEGVMRVTKIVRDLKNFARSAGDEDWQRADLHDGIDSTLNIVWNELKYKADVNKQYGALPQVECRPSQLSQVFMNMLVNSANAIKGRGTISIRTGVKDAEVWIEFADTGEGIRPEHLSRIFDPFFTTKPVGKGTGLGLSVSYGIVQDHRGRIEVTSEVGKGTVFRVWLPVTQPDRGEPVPAQGDLPDAAQAAACEPARPAIPREPAGLA